MKAIVLTGAPNATLVHDRPVPKLRDDYVLVDVKAVALNPTDWKHREYPGLNVEGCLSGCDYSGVVAEIGPNCVKQFKVGDRIAGVAHGANSLEKEDGSFAEKIVVRSGGQFHIPDSTSFADAAGWGVAYLTVGQGLYQKMGLSWPKEEKKSGEWLFIYGGSSAMGTVGIEFAKLSGYKVVTVCSPRNFELARRFGADEVFDYKDENVVEKIKGVVGGEVKLVWDTISTKATVKICDQIIAEGGKYGSIGQVGSERKDIETFRTLAYSAIGEEVNLGGFVIPKEVAVKDYEWAMEWASEVERLLAEGKIKPHPPYVRKGLEGVIGGMDEMKNDQVSGKKLVYTL